ncbi:MAG: ABC transporter ATP-binding protein, partial [Planctomycetota bacterium]|nr:ABC transporter ATP-binding protein [Planctomycetota bacterium]
MKPLLGEEVVAAAHIAKRYHDGARELAVLRDINLSVRRGETVAIIGRSGTGKSTLLHILGLLDIPDAGVLRLAGRDVAGLSEGERTALRGQMIGFVFQQYHLISELDALENVALAAAVGSGGWKGAHGCRAREILAAMGLSDRERHRPHQLSGGEQQRTAIAISLANRPMLLLADEPTGSVDSRTSDQIMN